MSSRPQRRCGEQRLPRGWADAYPGSSIRIYNRWGDLLFSSNDFGTTAGWDPSAEEAAEGTYYYELSILRGQDELSVITLDGETLYPPNGDPVLT